MYEEELQGDDEDELEDIIEEAHEEESDQSEGSARGGPKRRRRNNGSNLERDLKSQQREDLKNLRTQMLTMKDQLLQKASRIEEIKSTLKQGSEWLMKQTQPEDKDESSLAVNQQQRSFIGGVPTDQIIDVLDGEEEVLVTRLQEINENEEPEKDKLLGNSDESENEGLGFGSDQDEDDGMDNGIKD